MKQLEYPLVECDAHPGEREPGYIVCPHVLSAVAVFHLKRATQEELGVVCCKDCDARSAETNFVLGTFVLSCAQGLREKGILASA